MNILNNLANQYKDIFPLKGEITPEILKTGERFKIRKCFGALTLKAALQDKIKPEDLSELSWGNIEGELRFSDNSGLTIGTNKDTNFMDYNLIPQSVTFIIS